MDVSIIAKKLRYFGKKKFKTNKEFAEHLDMKPQSWDKYLNGVSVPGGLILQKLAKLGCDINWLLTGDTYIDETVTGTVKESSAGTFQVGAARKMKVKHYDSGDVTEILSRTLEEMIDAHRESVDTNYKLLNELNNFHKKETEVHEYFVNYCEKDLLMQKEMMKKLEKIIKHLGIK